MKSRDLEEIVNLAQEIVNEDFYFGSAQDKLALIRALAERVDNEMSV